MYRKYSIMGPDIRLLDSYGVIKSVVEYYAFSNNAVFASSSDIIDECIF